MGNMNADHVVQDMCFIRLTKVLDFLLLQIVRHKLDVIPPVAPQSPDMSLVEEDEQT